MRSIRDQTDFHPQHIYNETNVILHRRANVQVLIGVLTMDSPHEVMARNKFRKLYTLEPQRICSLHEFRTNRSDACELIYTFVMGSARDEEAPTELLNDTERLFLTNPPNSTAEDIGYDDITHLNIKENMNDGKSTTWLAYALSEQRKLGFDYVVNTDSDSMPLLDKYFQFTKDSLPPAPYNRNILSGHMVDKFWWWKDYTQSRKSEEFFRKKYGKVIHLYAEGQWYLLSPDLIETVIREAPNAIGTYAEHHEDHDVSAVAFHKDLPIHLIVIANNEMHWIHNIKPKKNPRRFRKKWAQELERYGSLVSAKHNTT